MHQFGYIWWLYCLWKKFFNFFFLVFFPFFLDSSCFFPLFFFIGKEKIGFFRKKPTPALTYSNNISELLLICFLGNSDMTAFMIRQEGVFGQATSKVLTYCLLKLLSWFRKTQWILLFNMNVKLDPSICCFYVYDILMDGQSDRKLFYSKSLDICMYIKAYITTANGKSRYKMVYYSTYCLLSHRITGEWHILTI